MTEPRRDLVLHVTEKATPPQQMPRLTIRGGDLRVTARASVMHAIVGGSLTVSSWQTEAAHVCCRM